MALEIIPELVITVRPKQKKVPFYGVGCRMKVQDRDQWCWAAVVQFALACFGWSSCQCRIANDHFRRLNSANEPCCCQPKDTGKFRCNRIQPLSQPLQQQSCLRCWHGYSAGPSPPDLLNAVIDDVKQGRVVALRLVRPLSAHFIAVSGYSRAQFRWLSIQDPWGATLTSTRVDDFVAGNVSTHGHSWEITEVFWTRSPREEVPPCFD